MIYQMTFAIITVALVVGLGRGPHAVLRLRVVRGAVDVHRLCADRALGLGRRLPRCRRQEDGMLDFAGGTVVHLNAGVAGLVAAYVVGKRHGYGTDNLSPYNLSLAVIGTGLLWVGWFGFNGGSALGAELARGLAIVATHLAACDGRADLDGAGMVDARQAVGARHDLGRGRRPRHHHAGVRLRAALARPGHRPDRRRRSASGPAPSSSRCSATTTRSTCSACTASAALTGTLLAGVFAVARRSATPPGLLEGNGGQVLIQLYGVAVDHRLVGRRDLRDPEGDRASSCRCGSAQQSEIEGLDVTQHGESLQ